MTEKRALKAIIRARMAKTGESYTTARLHVLRDQAEFLGGERPLPSPGRARSMAVPEIDWSDPALPVVVDVRHETVCIAARLAGFLACNHFRRSAYAARVDEHFAPFRRHPAVAHLEWLGQRRGMDYWFLLQWVVRVTSLDTFATSMPYQAPFWAPETTWTLQELEELAAHLRDFVTATGMEAFIAEHLPLFDEARRRLSNAITAGNLGPWLREFHSATGDVTLCLAPSFLTRTQHYIAETGSPDGSVKLHGFVEPNQGTDDRGIPVYGRDLDARIVELFCRLRVNAEVSIHEHALRAAAERLFEEYYPNTIRHRRDFPSIMSHTIRQALCARYLLDVEGESALERFLESDSQDPIPFWRRPLMELLAEYHRDRTRYPGLGDFMPPIAAFFAEISSKPHPPPVFAEQRLDLRAEPDRAPRIVRAHPPLDAQDVDPDLNDLRLEFDRRMINIFWRLPHSSEGRYPIVSDEMTLDESGTILTVPVRLEPEVTYALQLNSDDVFGLADSEGIALAPTLYRFTTGSKRTR